MYFFCQALFLFFFLYNRRETAFLFSSGNAFLHLTEATSRVFLYNKSIYHKTQAARIFVYSTLSCLVFSQLRDTFS